MIIPAMKALITFIAIAAVSAAGAGFYYVSSTSEPVQRGSTCGGGQKAPWHCGYHVTIQ
jgi:hypothetical protein